MVTSPQKRTRKIFEHELTYALLHQIFSFNSPVWFNVGTSSPMQVSGALSFLSTIRWSPFSDCTARRPDLQGAPEPGSTCRGSGRAGNCSPPRHASGPVSFMRGRTPRRTIKSAARRARGQDVVLDVDHPDVEEFIETKAREEENQGPARCGFDMTWRQGHQQRPVPERQQLGAGVQRVHGGRRD